jgi:hypothetical protein
MKRIWRGKNCLKNFSRKIRGKRPPGRQKRRWKDNIKTDLEVMWVRVWSGFIWIRIRSSGGLLWTRYKTCGYIKGGEFLDQLSNYSAPWSYMYTDVKFALLFKRRTQIARLVNKLLKIMQRPETDEQSPRLAGEGEGVWKATVVAYFKVLSRHFTNETEENHEKYKYVQPPICTRDLPNTKQECQPLNHGFRITCDCVQ